MACLRKGQRSRWKTRSPGTAALSASRAFRTRPGDSSMFLLSYASKIEAWSRPISATPPPMQSSSCPGKEAFVGMSVQIQIPCERLTRTRYRNIQMMISYIQNAQADGCDCFPGKLPTIIRLQDMIEYSWDAGFGSVARLETGGIRGTRKYIGTPEVCGSLCWRPPSIDLGRHKLCLIAWESGRNETTLLWNPAQASLGAPPAHTSSLQTLNQLS